MKPDSYALFIIAASSDCSSNAVAPIERVSKCASSSSPQDTSLYCSCADDQELILRAVSSLSVRAAKLSSVVLIK